MQNDISFAWRGFQIEPDAMRPNGQWAEWPEANARDHPRPPRNWHRHPNGFSKSWTKWRSAEELSDDQVVGRRTYSIVWCQPTQVYYVMREDCTRRTTDPNREEPWQTLYCRQLRPGSGLCELLDWGDARHHDLRCPKYFDEFLPRNFFRGVSPGQSCHFFGHLSLILGLLAMCPGNVNNIPRQIDQIFYYNNEPRFRPWHENSPDGPMDRWRRLHPLLSHFSNTMLTRSEYPGRAIVMQTGIIKRDSRSTEEQLEYWEKGRKGPLVSSENPTEAERRTWRNPGSGR